MATAKPVNKNRSLGMLGFMLLLVGFAASYYFFLPQLTTARADLETAESQLAGVNQDIATLKQAQTQLTSVKADLVAKGVDFSTINSHFPLTESMPEMYIQMESLSRSANYVSNFEYSVSAPVLDPTTNRARIPVSVSVVGQYPQLKQLLANLQNLVRPVLISQGSISAYTNTDRPAGSYTMVLAGYSQIGGLSNSYSATPVK